MGKDNNPFKELASIVLEDFQKFGSIDDNGNIIIDSKLQKQIIGKIKERKIRGVIQTFTTKEDLAKQLLEIKPMYYDKYKIWWVWDTNDFRWKIVDETDILNLVSESSFANTIISKERTEIIEALKQKSRLNKPKEIKPTWIQFKDKIVDIKTGEEFVATSKYFVTNPIPHPINEERFVDTPTIDKIFEEWVGKDYIQTLYEIIAYSLIPNYPIHRIFCFIGEGMNGKSCFLNLLRKFIGDDNCCATELDTLLSSRFEITRLHKKLVCQMGETNFNEMSKTSILKKLSGGDLIGYEYKNKNPFEEKNYAKIIIATNNLPTTTDKTIGFYRRWMIIDFPNRFSEQKDILNDIPEEEYTALASKSVIILKDLLDKRSFHNEGSIEERAKKYEDKSDPIEKFLNEFTKKDFEGFITKNQFAIQLNQWLKQNRFRFMSDVAISKLMKSKDIEEGKEYIDWFEEGKLSKKQARVWFGITWKNDKTNKTTKT